MSDAHAKLLDGQSQMTWGSSLTKHIIDTRQTKSIKVTEEGSSWFWRKNILLFAGLSMLNTYPAKSNYCAFETFASNSGYFPKLAVF